MNEKKALREFAKVTYEILDNTNDMEVIKTVKKMLLPIYELIDKEVAQDLGFDLWLWVGLKEDAPRLSKDSKMANEFGEGIMEGFGEYLK